MRNLPVLDERAAFVDVGSEHMHVSIAGGAGLWHCYFAVARAA